MLNKANKVFLMSCLAVLLLSNGSLAEKEEKIPKVTPVFEVQDLFFQCASRTSW